MTRREHLEAFIWGALHPFATDEAHEAAAMARVRKYHPELYEAAFADADRREKGNQHE